MMYLKHFGLQESPFSITPDPAYLFLSQEHELALSHLIYGAQTQNGFIVLSGEVGTGKTTLVRTLLEKRLDDVDVALCLNPQLSARELVENICDELAVSYKQQDSLKQLIGCLNKYLLDAYSAGRRTVVIIDEAQHLDRDVLEQLRLLTNLETDKHKLLHIILVGQPELEDLLQRHDLRQLSQRVTARFQLGKLSPHDTATYVSHRLSTAGARPTLFTQKALNRVYRYTGGTPRLINVLCERALIVAYANNALAVNDKHIKQAAAETWPDNTFHFEWNKQHLFIGALLILLAVLAAILLIKPSTSNPQQDVAVPIKININPSATVQSPNTELAALWDIPASLLEGNNWCDNLAAIELRCASGSANWQGLLHFDHPTLVTLAGKQVLLKAVNDSEATIVSDTTKTLAVSEFQQQWQGDFKIITRTPVGLNILKPGQVHPATRWLRRILSSINNQQINVSNSELYDATLQNQVKAFQQQNGLTVDGVVGGTTIALLNTFDKSQQRPRLQQQ